MGIMELIAVHEAGVYFATTLATGVCWVLADFF